MSTTLVQPQPTVPPPSPSNARTEIRERLEAMVRHARRQIWLRGGLIVIATALFTLLALVVADAVFQLEARWLRSLLVLIGLTGVGLAARQFILLPLRRDCSELDVAWQLEEEHPEMEERLTSTLQFADPFGHNSASTRLISVVAQQAQQSVASVDDDEVNRHSILHPTIAAAFCTLIAALSLMIWPQYLLPSLANILSPWSTRSLPHLNAIVTPGDVSVAQGDPVAIEVTSYRELTGALLEILSGDSVLSEHLMAADDQGHRAQFLMTAITQDTTYRIRSAGLYSRPYLITVRPKPSILRINAQLNFPSYTGIPPACDSNLRHPIEAPVGTRITLTAHSNVKSATALLDLNHESVPADHIVSDEASEAWLHQWEFEITEKMDCLAKITLISEQDVHSDPWQVQIRAIQDMPPSIQIVVPNHRQLTLQPRQHLPVRFQTADDFGIRGVRLMIAIDDQQPTHTDLPIQRRVTDQQLTTDVKDYTGETSLDLATFDLKSGNKVTLWLQASDNRSDRFGGGQTVDSNKIEIRIDEKADELGQQVIRQERQQIDEQLTSVIDKLQAAKELAQKLASTADNNRDDAVEKEETDDASGIEKPDNLATARKLRQELDSAKQALDDMTHQETPAMFQPQMSTLKNIAEKEVTKAQQQADRIPLADGPKQMSDEAAKVQQTINEAVEKFQQIQADIEQQSEALELAARLDQLARQQDHLANEIQQQESRQEASDAQKTQKDQQQRVADELQQLVNEDDDAKSKQFDQRADQAEQLADEAKDIARQQKQLAQLGENQQNLQQDSQAAKKQLLEMIAREQDVLAEEARGQDKPAKGNEPADAKEAAQEKRPKQKNGDDLARQQRRVAEAMQAAKENQLDEAAAKLQEQIADRAERLQEKAEKLLKQPTEDKKNQDAVQEAEQKLKEAQEKARAADEQCKRCQQKGAQSKQQPGQQAKTQGVQDKQQSGKQGNPQDTRAKQQANKQDAQDKQPSGQQGKPQDGQEERGKAREQQKEAAKSIQEAAQSLEKVCQSCRECAKCNNPKSGSSGSKTGGKQPSSQMSSKPSDSGISPEPNPAQSSPRDSRLPTKRAGKPDPEQLAKAADKVNQAARTPSKRSTKEAAGELNKVADEAAAKANYPYRRRDQNQQPSGQKSGEAFGQQQGISDQQENGTKIEGGNQRPEKPGASSRPMQDPSGKRAQGSEGTPDVRLRGGSTSNWTRSRKQLRGNVLDDKAANVPEQFRDVVEGYFEELARQESKQAKPVGKKDVKVEKP